jgi:hypothetical protein
MKNLPILGAIVVALSITTLSTTPADARAGCKNADGSKCQAAKTSKKFANTSRGSRHAARARTRVATAQYRRLARNARDDFPWHGWAGSFHLDGARYPGGNPVGPRTYYNNYEGGFHNVAFWTLQERGRF